MAVRVKARYPHMKPGEAAIWERFSQRLPWPAESIRYDIRLGKGVPLPIDTEAWVSRMVWALSTKRLDVLVETRREVVLVEVKERAAMSAVGQLLGYLVLFRDQFPTKKVVRLVCVCERIAPDMGPVFREYGIEVYVV